MINVTAFYIKGKLLLYTPLIGTFWIINNNLTENLIFDHSHFLKNILFHILNRYGTNISIHN